jgi:hypothetical protein
MLNRAWVAFQLSSLSQCETNLGDPFIVEFVCPGVCPTDGYTICTPSDVEDIRAGYNRTQQEGRDPDRGRTVHRRAGLPR